MGARINILIYPFFKNNFIYWRIDKPILKENAW